MQNERTLAWNRSDGYQHYGWVCYILFLFGSSNLDSVNGVTECPIQPGGSRTYTFIASEYGTSWYHSHHSSQYGDGVAGSILINGPASANYDYDLGVMPVTDLYYNSAYSEGLVAEKAPPIANNGLINGTNMNKGQTAGSYNTVSDLIPGAKYLLRLVNMAVDNHFILTLDSHPFTVVSADFVPIVPYNTTSLFIAIGQRYDVIFTANQTPDNYWFRALIPSGTIGAQGGGGCGSNDNGDYIRAIFNYQNVTVANPNSTVSTIVNDQCQDETQIVPYVAKDVPASAFIFPSPGYKLGIEFLPGGGSPFEWNISTSPSPSPPQKPSLTAHRWHLPGGRLGRPNPQLRARRQHQLRARPAHHLTPERQRMGLLGHHERKFRPASYPSARS